MDLKKYLTIAIVGIVLVAGGVGETYSQTKKKSTPGKTAVTKSTLGKKAGTSGKSGKTSGKTSGKKSTSTATKKGTKTGGSKETVSDVKKKQADTQKEIALTKEQIKANELQVKRGLNDLGKLQTDIEEGQKKLQAVTSEVKDIEGKISVLQGDIDKGEQDLGKLRAEYLKSVKKMRTKMKTNSELSFIFSSKNFSEAMQRMRYLKQFSDWRKRQSALISKKVEGLRAQQQELAESKEAKDVAVRKQSAVQNTLQKQYVEQDAVVVKLKQTGSALKNHLAQKQQEANALKGRIASLIAEEERKAKAEAERKAKEAAAKEAAAKAEAAKKAEADRKAKEAAEKNLAQNDDKSASESKTEKKADKTSGKKTEKKATATKTEQSASGKDYAEARKRRPRGESSAPSSTTGTTTTSTTGTTSTTTAKPSVAGNFENMKGSLPRPVSGSFKITSRFGRHSLPELPDVMYDNPGIDAEVSSGATAQAVYGGKVSGVYMIPGYSTVVIVNHGNYYTVYGNIQSPSVKVGDTVKQGQGLGRLAAEEDDSSHSSIHFEVWHNREKLNPSEWIR